IRDFHVTGVQTCALPISTHGTPLIRYRIGDRIVFREGTCTCGSSHPLVDRIEGRAVDYLYSAERGRVSLSHLADVIKGLPNCVKIGRASCRERVEISVGG